VTLPENPAAGSYTFTVSAQRRGSTSSKSASKIVVKLPATNVTLSFSEYQLNATWTQISGAGSFSFRAFDPQHKQIGDTQTVSSSDRSVAVPLKNPKSGTYTAQVQAIAANNTAISGNWSELSSVTPVTLTTPGPPTIIFAESKIQANWQALDGNNISYDLEVLHESKKVGGATGVTTTQALLTLDKGSFTQGQSYTVRVRANAASGVSLWSNQSNSLIIYDIATPEVVSVNFNAINLQTSWSAVTLPNGASGHIEYDAQLLQGSKVVGIATGLSKTKTALTLTDGSNFVNGKNYDVQVRAKLAGSEGAWSEKLSITIQVLGQVNGVKAGFNDNKINTSWTAVALPEGVTTGTVEYNVQLLKNDQVVGSANDITGTSATLTLEDGNDFTSNDTYQLEVQAKLGQSTGPWSDPLNITVEVLDKVSGVTAIFKKNKIKARWSAISLPLNASGSIEYEAQLLKDSQTVGFRTNLTKTSTTLTLADQSRFANNEVYQVQIRAKLDQSTGLWSDPLSITIEVLDQLTGLHANYSDNKINVGWATATLPDGASGTIKYDVKLLKDNGLVGSATGITETSTSLSLTDGDPFVSDQDYQIKGRSTLGDSIGPWSAKLDFVIPSTGTNGKIYCLWQAFPSPAGTSEDVTYDLRLLKDADVVSSVSNITGTSTELILSDGSPFKIGDSFKVQIRAVFGNSSGPWSNAVVTIVQPSTNGTISCSWPAVTPPSGTTESITYDVQLSHNGTVVASLENLSDTHTSLTLDNDKPFVAGQTYNLQIRTVLGNSKGPWGAPIVVTVGS